MPNEKRDVTFRMRLTPSEFEKLQHQSERTGLPMSEVMRSAWKKFKITELPSDGFAETALQLKRIGNNLNQLTRSANTGDVLYYQIKSVLEELTEIDGEIARILSGGDL